MARRKRIPLYLSALMALIAFAADCSSMPNRAGSPVESWAENGKPAADASYRKKRHGLAARLLVTSDADWEAKWNTPGDTVPRLSEVDGITKGQKVTALILVANPKIDESGRTNVLCYLRIERPDGTVSADQNGIDCLSGTLRGPPTNLRISRLIVGFSGDPGDPVGDRHFSVTVRNVVRNTIIQSTKVIRLEINH